MAGKPTYEELESRNRELEQGESEWKQAEKALEESERKYRGLLETMAEGLAVQSTSIKDDPIISFDDFICKADL